METQWIFFNELKDTRIRHDAQDKTGNLDDVVLDLQTGEVALYTLSSGGFLGMGEERVALPARALHLRGEEARLLVDQQRIHKAPGTGSDWPQQIDSTFIDEINRYYGFRS